MEENLNDVLTKMFAEVAEQMAFLFCEPAREEELSASTSSYVEARMTFLGPRRGALRIATTPELCRQVSANVLGIEPEDEQAQRGADDALKELLNVTCGRFLTAIAGEEAVFDLSVPAVSRLSAEEWGRFCRESEMARLMVEDSPVLLSVSVE